MDLDLDQPIAALASPAGGALRGIVRISGAGVRGVLSDWFIPDDEDAWMSAKTAASHVGRLRLDSSNEPIDCPVQVLFWPNRRSYTGQPLIELHLPGSPCLLETALGEAYRRGVRPARPGEFTLRAFLAGKVDLRQAEAGLGGIDAQNQVELQTALSQLAGGVSGRLSHLRRDLLELLADLEAGLDFVDEDIEFVSRHDVVDRLSAAHTFVDDLLRQANDRMQARVSPKVVLAGLPNAGKSTLFNRLAGTNAALVSPEQGTTRDFLTRSVTWDDLSFDLIDTAGWEEGSVGIAAAAQEQRIAQLQQSDLVVWCSSASSSETDVSLDNQLFAQAYTRSPNVLRLLTKIDLVDAYRTPIGNESTNDLSSIEVVTLGVSAITEAGLSNVQTEIRRRLSTEQAGAGQWLGMTAARCREALESIAASLDRAVNAAKVREIGDELIAVDLREALDHLGVILGVIYTDDILDRIFSKFCIGK
jgi:tRNA modification GTPase